MPPVAARRGSGRGGPGDNRSWAGGTRRQTQPAEALAPPSEPRPSSSLGGICSSRKTPGAWQVPSSCARPETPPPVGSRLCPLPRLLRVSLALLRPACPPHPLTGGGRGRPRWGLRPSHLHRLSNQMARNEVEGLLARHALGLGHLALADASVSRAPLQPREGGVLTEKPTEQRLTVPSDRTPGTHHLGCPREPRTASGPPAGARAAPGGGR